MPFLWNFEFRSVFISRSTESEIPWIGVHCNSDLGFLKREVFVYFSFEKLSYDFRIPECFHEALERKSIELWFNSNLGFFEARFSSILVWNWMVQIVLFWLIFWGTYCCNWKIFEELGFLSFLSDGYRCGSRGCYFGPWTIATSRGVSDGAQIEPSDCWGTVLSVAFASRNWKTGNSLIPILLFDYEIC